MKWETVKIALPVTLSPKDKARRVELWKKFNHRGAKHIALAEVDRACLKALGCEALFNAKPVIAKAFNYAREINPEGSSDKLDFSEFRLLLCYLKGLFEIYQVFQKADASKDMMLTLPELQGAKDALNSVGVKVEDPGALFDKLKGTDEQVSFHEFSDWAIRQNMGGTELLEQGEVLDKELMARLKQQLKGWEYCTDGKIGKEDFKDILFVLDERWTMARFEELCQLEGAPVEGEELEVDAFVEFLLSL